MKINISLNSHDISVTIKQLEAYEADLQKKCEQLVSELADIGIAVAKANTFVEVDDVYTNMGDAITFEKPITLEDGSVVCVLTATGQEFLKQWQNGSASVNPLLMAEFGSGWRAIDGHQGTFPNQKVAFMRPWHWTDSNGQSHESYGSEPSRPMFKALQEMENQISAVVERVFSA